ncbi:hypothetical protein K1719_040397 [Acacia pycnantha]|nr:hypothetical protein K1719_040397 [Acacia pycnantha]
MNRIFRQHLDQFVVVFIDDILIYSKSKEEHEEHLRKEVKFRAMLYLATELRLILAKWKRLRVKRPRGATEIRSFLGLAGYYRRFIRDFSRLALPLTKLTRKNQPFIWGDDCEESFEYEERLTTAGIDYPRSR